MTEFLKPLRVSAGHAGLPLIFLAGVIAPAGAACTAGADRSAVSPDTDDSLIHGDTAPPRSDTQGSAACRHTCSDQCTAPGGTVMPGVCPDAAQICCDVSNQDTEAPRDTGDSDSNTDGEAPCQHTCSHDCAAVGGTVMPGACPDAAPICCDVSSQDTGAPQDTGHGDTDSEVPCRYTCTHDCAVVGGTVMPGACPNAADTCCHVDSRDTDTGTGTDTAPDTETEGTACADDSSLQAAGACAGLLIGTAVSRSGLQNGGYARVAASEFGYLTPENEMKWGILEPNPGQFNFGAADEIVDWAARHDKKVKGHCLVWHSQLPRWMQGLGGADQVASAIRSHIETVMGHFKGRVVAWDVVNEAVLTDSDTGVGNPRMRDSVFFNALGEEYIDLAFQIAKENDPDAKLYYNDYSIDALNEKSDFAYDLMARLLDRGVPIDGIGFQMHIGPPNNLATGAEVAENLARFSALGLEVLISEMDVNLCGGQISPEAQLAYYHDIVAACVQQPACTAITFWGINDGSSWLNNWSTAQCNGQSSRSLLFDDQFQPKQTYHSVMDALLGR